MWRWSLITMPEYKITHYLSYENNHKSPWTHIHPSINNIIHLMMENSFRPIFPIHTTSYSYLNYPPFVRKHQTFGWETLFFFGVFGYKCPLAFIATQRAFCVSLYSTGIFFSGSAWVPSFLWTVTCKTPSTHSALILSSSNIEKERENKKCVVGLKIRIRSCRASYQDIVMHSPADSGRVTDRCMVPW